MRLLVAFSIGIAFAIRCWLQLHSTGDWIQANDFTYPWFGAREILAGRDPYVTIRNATMPWGPYLFYPPPAFLLAIPLAFLPAQVAGPVFVGLTAGFLAFVILPRGAWRLLIFVSAPMFVSSGVGQWSPFLIACALAVPAFGFLAAKPTIGLPLAAMQPNWRFLKPAIFGGLVLLVLSFVAIPHWVPEWLAASKLATRAGGYWVPATMPLGAVSSLALLRWRRPEARLLFVMAWMPQKLLFYDQLPLFLIPHTRRDLLIAVFASLVGLLYSFQVSWTTREATAWLAPAVLIGCYWPALITVLKRSPD
jgi:hypothetical protein